MVSFWIAQFATPFQRIRPDKVSASTQTAR